MHSELDWSPFSIATHSLRTDPRIHESPLQRLCDSFRLRYASTLVFSECSSHLEASSLTVCRKGWLFAYMDCQISRSFVGVAIKADEVL